MDRETIRAKGSELVVAVKNIVAKGNVKRVVVKDSNDKVLLDIPVTFAVVGAILAPVLAGIAFAVGMVKECSIEIERREK
jgi:hypothetical protein